MKFNSLTFLSVLLWTVCAFHIIIGAGINIFPEFPKLMASLYGAQVEWTAQFQYILKPLGAFMLALGVMAAIAARDPLSNRAIVYGFAVLFVLRALQRLVFQTEIESLFAISVERNLVASVFFFALAVALLLLTRSAQRQK